MTRAKVRNITKRLTVDLDDMDLANIDTIKELKGFVTISESIRHALNVTGRACRREALIDNMEIEALARIRERGQL